jgi:hypothetical protein
MIRLALAALLFCCNAAADQLAASDEAVEFGRRIYMEGMLSSGEPLKAIVNGDVEITGDFVVCGECHRKSGLGASEGQSVAPPVVGAILFEPSQLPTSRPPAPPVLRPAYTHETLATSIRDGISSNGSEFDLLMPRYPLADDEMGYLIAYLDSLSADADPGVTETHIHFATIITDDVDPAARKAMLDVMQYFIEQKNTETRYESKRATNGPWHKDWMFKRYRKWVLHTWELSGAPETWQQQLDDLYAQTPVFAIVNGLSGSSWEPVHDFCERSHTPCLFPTTNLPVVDREDEYSVYLSKGITIEAEAVAHQIRGEENPPAMVVQVFDPENQQSRAAASRLAELLGDAVLTVPIDDFEWESSTVAVLWLAAEDVNSIASKKQELSVYLSGSLLDGRETDLDDVVRDNAQIVYSTALPSETTRLLMRSTGWFRIKRIYAPEYQAIQANAYFTMKMVGAGLFGIGTYFNRDFFIESIEHMVDNATYTSVYPYMSLAPQQRFVSKGVRIGAFDSENPDRLVTVVDWLIPDVQ